MEAKIALDKIENIFKQMAMLEDELNSITDTAGFDRIQINVDYDFFETSVIKAKEKIGNSLGSFK